MNCIRDMEHVFISRLGSQNLKSPLFVEYQEVGRLRTMQRGAIDCGVTKDGNSFVGRDVPEEMVSNGQ